MTIAASNYLNHRPRSEEAAGQDIAASPYLLLADDPPERVTRDLATVRVFEQHGEGAAI